MLKQAEVGVPMAELIRKTGITEQTYYLWLRIYSSNGTDVALMLCEEWSPLQPGTQATLDHCLKLSGFAIPIAQLGLARLANLHDDVVPFQFECAING